VGNLEELFDFFDLFWHLKKKELGKKKEILRVK
jgi:hypothetical protein